MLRLQEDIGTYKTVAETVTKENRNLAETMAKMRPLVEFVNSFDAPENLKKILTFLRDDLIDQYAGEKLRLQGIEFSPYISDKLNEIAERKGITRKEALEELVKKDLEILEKSEKKLKKLETRRKERIK